MKTVVYYFSATGNSLYAAKYLKNELKAEIYSMTEMLRNKNFETNAEKIGFIFPLHYGSLPFLVEEFVHELEITNAKYIFAISTCGVPYLGRPFTDLNEILAKKDCKLSASWFLRLVSNYLMIRDTAADWRIKIRYYLAKRKLAKISKKIEKNEPHTTLELHKAWCKKMHDDWEDRKNQNQLDKDFLCDIEKCIKCGLCEKICPVDNIIRPKGSPEWQHHCIECLACLHICPKQAINNGNVTEGRKRYINWNIKSNELLKK